MKIYQLVYHLITDILQGVVMKYYYIECRGHPIIDELPTLNDGIDAVLYCIQQGDKPPCEQSPS